MNQSEGGGTMTMWRSNNAFLVLILTFVITIDGIRCNPLVVGGGGGAIFDITKYGAKGDGRSDDATAIISAFRAACDSRGPSRVLIPRGRQFLASEIIFEGPCTAKPITIDIQGTLLASDDLSMYSNGAWIMMERVDGAVLTGGGTINGRGMNSWKYADGGGSLLPVSLILQTVTNSKVSRLSLLYSMGFHMKVTDSVNIGIDHLRIRAPKRSPNTDGIHLSNATNVNITDSKIGTGDDCISIGHGTNNIHVARITCGPGHGISVGSLGKRPDELNVKGITVINCTLAATTNGARIKTYHSSPKITASSITFQDLVMDRVQNPIVIDQHYGSRKGGAESSVILSDIHFRNIRGTTVTPVSIDLDCSSAYPCQGVELSNINLSPFGSVGPLKSACSNAKFFTNGQINPPAPLACS